MWKSRGVPATLPTKHQHDFAEIRKSLSDGTESFESDS
jgi:hypothetical protein